METGGSSKNNSLKTGDQEKNNVIEGGSNIFAPPLQKKKIERVRLMLPLKLLCISPELTRATCLVTSTLKKIQKHKNSLFFKAKPFFRG